MHELITINMLYSLKTIFHITPLPPHNGHLSTLPGVEDLSPPYHFVLGASSQAIQKRMSSHCAAVLVYFNRDK